MPDPVPPTEQGAPAPTGPDGGDLVQVELGPDASIYPERFLDQTRPSPEPPPAPPDGAPEPEPAGAPETDAEVAGAAESPQAGETRGTRRRAAEDAYQRGLTEGRAAYEQQLQQQNQVAEAERIQREAVQRVENLFQQARSTDYNTRNQAWNTILQMYDGNRQAQALMQTTRQQILNEMANDFANVRNVDASVTDEDYQSLHTAPNPGELVKRAFDLCKRARDEQVARLEAENQGLRGRLVGSRATPEAHNGQTSDLSNPASIEEYLAMSPKEARKLTSAQIDALTNQLAAAAERNGRSF